ncbi:MAG: DNA recombination protein RmuC [Nitrospirae bacterium]|nr:DNA recombination protein RmuC [Nitrospirota bacterium]
MIEILLVVAIMGIIALAVMSLQLLKRDAAPLWDQAKIKIDGLERNQERLERTLKEEISRNREEAGNSSRSLREEMMNSLKSFNDSLLNQMQKISSLQNEQFGTFTQQLNTLTQSNEQRLEKMRLTVEEKLKSLQEDNSQKLEKMRETVDEKLHATLEKRLGESFKLVSERLELVHKGLGEMQSLAIGVGDLKKVLSNVKTRGILGEFQLGSILEQILAPEQYAKNVATKKGSRENVEFAIILPGKDDNGAVVYLPLDSKFPVENYHTLLEAYEHGDHAALEEASKQLEATIKKCAKAIRDKYLDPPGTTDFGIMFLPFEGLYAEVVKRTGLIEILQREYKVIITGPTTLAAILNSLQMGFRTLAIEKRSSEVWTLLSAVKTEFGKFGDILEKTQKKLQEASNTIEDAAKKSRTIEKKLKNVQVLTVTDTQNLLGDADEQ